MDGQAVKEGEPLLQLDPTINTADEERAARELMQAKLDIARLRTLTEPEHGFEAPEGADPGLTKLAKLYTRAQADGQAAKVASFDRQID